MFNDEIGTTAHIDRAAKQRLDLPGYAVGIKDGTVAAVQLPSFLHRGYSFDIIFTSLAMLWSLTTMLLKESLRMSRSRVFVLVVSENST